MIIKDNKEKKYFIFIKELLLIDKGEELILMAWQPN